MSIRVIAVAVLLLVPAMSPPATADDTGADSGQSAFHLWAKKYQPERHRRARPLHPVAVLRPKIVNACPAGQTAYTRWVRTRTTWDSSPTVRCIYGPPKAAIKIKPRVTAAMVLRAFRRIPLPHPLAQSQPSTKTLVNFETIFYVNQGPLTRRVRLLGQRITLAIRPARFVWHHGDGSQAVTDTPGAAYPARDITYRYTRADVTVRHSVTITWTARYRVNNGRWRMVPGTVTTNGPASRLRITEAVPVLSGLR